MLLDLRVRAYLLSIVKSQSILKFQSALTHVPANNSIIVQNSLVIGSITPNDCNDLLDTTSNNLVYAQTAIPSVSATSSDSDAGGRSGIVFPFISGGDNMMPRHPWTNIDAYPCSAYFYEKTKRTSIRMISS